MRVVSPAALVLIAATAAALPAQAQSGGPARYDSRPPVAGAPYGAPIPAPGAPAYHPAPPPRMDGPRVHQDMRTVVMPPRGPMLAQPSRQRWGGMVDGRWYAGTRAPGGWNAYRRMGHGDRLPRYWRAPDFAIIDYLAWGLAAPAYGYHWARYYDDAVLVDDRGRVWDSVGGIAWDGDDYVERHHYGYDDDYAHSYSESHASVGADYPLPAPDGDRHGRAWGGTPPPVVYAPPAAAAGYAYGGVSSYSYSSGGSVVTVINIPGPVTTTTTTTTQVVKSRATVARHCVVRKRVCRCRCR